MDKTEINDTLVMLLEQTGKNVEIDRDNYLIEYDGVETLIGYDRAKVPGPGPVKYTTCLYWGSTPRLSAFRRHVRRDGTFPFEEVVEFIQKLVAQIHEEQKQQEINRKAEQAAIKTLENLGVDHTHGIACFGEDSHLNVCMSGCVGVKLTVPANSPNKLRKVVALLRELST
jgi:hypothetical protein